MRNLAENKGGNFKIYIFYCEFSCFGFSHSQDDRAGISKNLQLFLSLPWLFLDCILTVVEFLMLEIQPTFFYKISPRLPFSMYIIMVGRKNALRNKITEKTEFVYFFF